MGTTTPLSEPASDTGGPSPSQAAAPRRWRERALVGVKAFILWALVFALYFSPLGKSGFYDTAAITLLPYCLMTGDGPFLDHFRIILQGPDGTFFPYVRESHGHVVS